MRKVRPPADYPPEPGRYLRGNDFSPAAVVVTLNGDYQNIPAAVEALVRRALEGGAALAGTLQTANVGIEKIVANVVANPNIRYLVLCGEEVKGHLAGGALRALVENGIDRRRVIVGTKAPTAYLFNLPLAAIERFCTQVTLLDLLGETDLDLLAEAVRACCQEEPVAFRGYLLRDPGAYPEAPLCATITWRIRHPEEVEEWELEDIGQQLERAQGGGKDDGGNIR